MVRGAAGLALRLRDAVGAGFIAPAVRRPAMSTPHLAALALGLAGAEQIGIVGAHEERR